MKKSAILLLLGFFGVTSTLFAQNSSDDIKNMIESKKIVFTAEVANSARGGSKQLSSGYTLTVTSASVISDLPFYGEAQSVPIGGIDPGIKFTSNKFDYKYSPYKKGWQITIKPNDVSYVYQLILNVYANGTANLDVMSTNRDNMSFNGYIK